MTAPPSALRGKIKYFHARMPGRELVHLIPPGALEFDERFNAEEFLFGVSRALCGRRSEGWIVGAGGELCPRCVAKR